MTRGAKATAGLGEPASPPHSKVNSHTGAVGKPGQKGKLERARGGRVLNGTSTPREAKRNGKA